MSGPADVIWIAGQEADAHVVESPAGSNQVKYWDWWFGRSGVTGAGAWCGAFVSWCFDSAGLPLPAINTAKGFSYCPDAVYYAHTYGEAVSEPLPGDIVLFSWYGWGYGSNGIPVINDGGQYNGETPGDHTGIFAGWNGDGTFTSLEGNTSASSWDNGGAVLRRADRWAYQACTWWRPSSYGAADTLSAASTNGSLPTGSAALGASGGMVVRIQQFLTQMSVRLGWANINPGAADGSYGPQTQAAVTAWQKVLFPQAAAEWDGEWGPRTAQASINFQSAPILAPPTQPTVPNPPPLASNQPAQIPEDADVYIHEARERPSLYQGLKVLDFDFAAANAAVVNGKMYQSSFLHISPVEPVHSVPDPFYVQVWNVGPSNPAEIASAPVQEYFNWPVFAHGSWWPIRYYGRIAIAFDPSKPIRAFIREAYFPL